MATVMSLLRASLPIRFLGFLLCLGSSLVLGAAGDAQAAKIKLDFSNLRNHQGRVYISVYLKKDGFPGVAEKAFRREKVELSSAGDFKELTLDDLPEGDLAIAMIHDENSNGILDTNFLGIPTEGYATSNNPKPAMRAPQFEESRITLQKEETKTLDVIFRYP